ncbi:hypothetical protein Ngar_c27130 [Candidatus Nitrososphaera gargensis Ga9.2]|uniref:Uncharacterized protein n=1 Tax=Nitrososphaera gargensis (strain Ga9.2) TaxID=1237085 RepID=K0INM5_NITGG|nr:hypothetical protein Ngar_c27130 [Candidatus Nitrososphaera gargensis Ga9.2]
MQLVVHKGERFYKSFKPVAVLKKMLGVLFELVSKENIDRLTEQWAAESRNIVLLSGSSFFFGDCDCLYLQGIKIFHRRGRQAHKIQGQ